MTAAVSTSRARRRLRGAVALLGWVTIVVAVDYGLGAAWTRSFGEESSAQQQVAAVVEGQIVRDPRADVPALADAPWAEDYLSELNAVHYDFWPFTIARLATFQGEYINTAAGARHSRQPPGADDPEALEVWFFGGSTMFGEGQRDAHTIPSVIARLAEADGIALRSVNYGHQGHVMWQEMLRLESELAVREHPDLIVFYDGVNDYSYQLEAGTGQPTHGQLDLVADRLDGVNQPLPTAVASLPDPIWDQFVETSLVGKLTNSLAGLASIPPAAAQEGTGAEQDFLVQDLAFQRNVLDVYGRTVDLSRLVAGDVPTAFFWQPIEGDQQAYREVAAALPDGVVDLTHTLDDPGAPVYIDGAHTNELGAALVAEAIYASILPELQIAMETRDR